MNLLDARRKLLPMPHPCFGDGGDTSSATNYSTSTSVRDSRAVADNGAVIVGENGRADVVMTDLDAVQKGADVAQAGVLGATQVATATAKGAFDLGTLAISQLADAYDSAAKNAQDLASGNKTLVLVAIVGGVLAFAQYSQRQKGKA